MLKCMKLNWNFQRGGGGGVLEKISFVGVRYGCFLELHNGKKIGMFAKN